MIYANPIYDTAFKGLIHDTEIAKVIIGTLLQTEIVDVKINTDKKMKPKIKGEKFPRSVELDFCATILDEFGEQKKILIEIQKTSNPEDILRFRQYLAHAGYGEKYTKKEGPLPIITFYFLGFNLDKIKTPCLRVSRTYFDMIDEKVVNTKEKFVELLTHDSYIIQIPRIKYVKKPTSKLAKVLSIFEQNITDNCDSRTLTYKFPVDDSLTKMMINRLLYVYADPEARDELDNEEYWFRRDDATYGELARKIVKNAELEKVNDELVKERDYVVKKHDEVAKKHDEVAKERDEVAKERDDAVKELDELKKKQIETAIKFKLMGLSVDEIAKLTGLSVDEIEKL
jgi:hypothetical protein